LWRCIFSDDLISPDVLIFAIGRSQDRDSKSQSLRRAANEGILMTERSFATWTGVVACVAMGALLSNAASAQSVTDPPPEAPSSAELVPPPADAPPKPPTPNLFGTIGKWMDDSLGQVTSGWNNARATDAAKGAADAARDAASTVMRIPTTSIVTGRGHCTRTASGGPDCQAATDALCRTKGFSAGTSLHVQSEEKCPVWGWVKGEKPVGRCGTETYVTSAMCR
jgi:hypothetical protein